MIGVDKLTCIYLSVGNVGKELVDVFVALFLDEFHQHGLVNLYLAVFSAAHKFLLAEVGTCLKLLVEFLANLVAALRAYYNVHPVRLWRLCGGGKYLDGVAALYHMAYLAVASVDNCSCAVCSNIGVDIEGEVEHRRSGRKLEEVALRSEGVNFLGVDIHADILHQLHGVVLACLEDISDIVHPLVGGVRLHALVAPVCSKTFLCHEVHSLRAELHLHPF